MRFLVIDSNTTAWVDAETKARAAAVYATRQMPTGCRARQYELRVVDPVLATRFHCLATRDQATEAVNIVIKEAW